MVFSYKLNSVKQAKMRYKALKLFNQANNRGEVVTNVSLGVNHDAPYGSLWNVVGWMYVVDAHFG